MSIMSTKYLYQRSKGRAKSLGFMPGLFCYGKFILKTINEQVRDFA